MDMKELSRDVVTNKVSGYVVDPDSGDKYEAKFKDLTDSEREELAELEEKAQEGDADAADEMQRKVVDDYLLHDDFKASELGVAWKQSILVGFLRALGDNKALQEAEEFFDTMQERQGNR